MSLSSINESYLAPLDAHGKFLYDSMRAAESKWIENTGFRHIDLENRTHLLIAQKTTLPSIKELVDSRRKFKEYLDGAKEDPSMNIGVRSTALPVWICHDKKIPVSTKILKSQLVNVDSIIIRTQPAWRGALLNYEETIYLLDSSIQKTHQYLKNALENRQAARAKELTIKITQLQETRNLTDKLFTEHGSLLSARVFSGKQTKFLFKNNARKSWTTSIANVGIVLGHEQTTVQNENPLKRSSKSKHDVIYHSGKIAFLKIKITNE